MRTYLLIIALLMGGTSAFSASSLEFTNDLSEKVQFLRINDEGYIVQGNSLLSPNPGIIKPGITKSFNIVHTPDEDQPAVREEQDQITEVRFDRKDQSGKWHTHACKLNEPFSPRSGKDLKIKASECPEIQK
jgi:hypothetical protein